MSEKKTILSEEAFMPLFGSWWNKIKPFFLQGGFDPIYAELKKSSARGKKICPDSKNVFKAFLECPIDELKCVIIGLSPYHTLNNGNCIADGLALSCSITNYPQPSLDQWFNAIEQELYNGVCVPCIKNPDLRFLANQGVLLLNSGLTCEANIANSHGKLWEPFMEFLFDKIINSTGVPIVFLGKEAQKLEKYTMPFCSIFRLSHPASAAYKGEIWDSEGTFKQINQLLLSNNGFSISWLQDELPF